MISNFIQFSIKNNTGIIHLNRPEVLNALNLEMAQQFYQQLKDWQNNPQVKRVLLKGKGMELCASADIKSLYLSSNKNDLKKNFFKWNTSSTMSSMNLINHI